MVAIQHTIHKPIDLRSIEERSWTFMLSLNVEQRERVSLKAGFFRGKLRPFNPDTLEKDNH
jgi:hypothetical protein